MQNMPHHHHVCTLCAPCTCLLSGVLTRPALCSEGAHWALHSGWLYRQACPRGWPVRRPRCDAYYNCPPLCTLQGRTCAHTHAPCAPICARACATLLVLDACVLPSLVQSGGNPSLGTARRLSARLRLPSLVGCAATAETVLTVL